MKRTTIMVPDETYEALRRLAEERGQRLSELVREALSEYVDRDAPSSRRFTFIGSGRSGEGDLSLRVEEVLGELLEEDHRRQWPRSS